MPTLQAVILAAGSSRRFPTNKLLQHLSDQRCLVDIAYALAGELTVQRLLVINSDEHMQLHCHTQGYNYLINSQAHTGMASSIAYAIAATPDADAWAIMLADMPCIQPATLQQLASHWPDHDITVPVYQQQQGHPVIFSHRWFDALCALQGDQGARGLLRDNPDIFALGCNDAGICFDIDTEEDWTAYLAHGCG